MGRHKAGKFGSRALSEEELASQFDQNLVTLSQLAKLYDNGYHPIALQMATEVHKLLTEGNYATKRRGNVLFSTIASDDSPNMINATHKLVGARVKTPPPVLDFVAAFQNTQAKIKKLKFKDWWNKDIIYRASAALPGTPPGMYPVNGSPSVPFDKREKINRRDFVALLRNTRGAHQSEQMPILLNELEDARNWSSFAVQTPEGILSTEDGTLTTGATIMAGMMRQITHEVLEAFGVEDVGIPIS